MMEGDASRHPIKLLVNYWENRPALMAAHLDEFVRQGIRNLATFVPWQAVESDISHALVRFLQAAADRKMSVTLILTPEVGVHYQNSGLPKDILAHPENAARDPSGAPVIVNLPPNNFTLPSVASSEFTKRYHNFLSRIDSLLADLSKTNPNLLENVTAVLTGGFWKYYRSARASSDKAFHWIAGDYSDAAGVEFRQRIDQFFSQREFADPSPASAARWKTRHLEEVSRRWYNQHSEDVFRSRSGQFVRRKAHEVAVEHYEMFAPEADPAFAYSNFLQIVSGGNGDFHRLSLLLDEAATRSTMVNEENAAPYVHWTGIGAFRTLSDSEKQFLILKSLLLMGGRGGGLLIDENEWFGLSLSFRSRTEALGRALAMNELSLKNRALYLAPHTWSNGGTMWDELHAKLGASARLVSSVNSVLADRAARIAIVDPSCIITKDIVARLIQWAKSGRVLVLPRSSLFTESARAELEQTLVSTTPMEITLGLSYRLHPIGSGKAVLYDPPEGRHAPRECLSVWQSFLASVLSIANVESYCSASDGRLQLIPLEKKDGGLGLFILNGAKRPVSGDIVFRGEVAVSDLAVLFSSAKGYEQDPVVPANRFSLEVPPCGVMPLSVDGIAEAEERKAAALTADLLKENAMSAAMSELPGLNLGEGIETQWN